MAGNEGRFCNGKKTCYTCRYTNYIDFDGTCPKAGEISGQFCFQEHPGCWEATNTDRVLPEHSP